MAAAALEKPGCEAKPGAPARGGPSARAEPGCERDMAADGYAAVARHSRCFVVAFAAAQPDRLALRLLPN